MIYGNLKIMKRHETILFYDGVCHLCHGLVQFILRYETSPTIMFSQLQSAFAKKMLTPNNLRDLSTVVLMTPGRIHTQSTAVVHVLWVMGGAWRMVAILLWLIPSPIRHIGYRVVAKYRYRFFGRSNECVALSDASRLISDP